MDVRKRLAALWTTLEGSQADASSENFNETGSAFFRSLCYGRTTAKDPRVQHGFADETHNACCLLGSKSRAEADASENAIGKLAAAVSSSDVAPGAMKPWSTCMGSAVCSTYGKNSQDAYMKFAISPDHSLMYLPAHGTRLEPACERWLQTSVFAGPSHGTPGVDDVVGDCPPAAQLSILRDVSIVPECLRE